MAVFTEPLRYLERVLTGGVIAQSYEPGSETSGNSQNDTRQNRLQNKSLQAHSFPSVEKLMRTVSSRL